MARIRQTESDKPFIGHLDRFDVRRASAGALELVSCVAAAKAGLATACTARALLAGYTAIGERGQVLRNPAAMAYAARGIQDLSLGKETSLVGTYYDALSLSRAGKLGLTKPSRCSPRSRKAPRPCFGRRLSWPLGRNSVA
jgi:hypothetical protein